MSSKELQHYVPRFLLRRFADPSNGRVHVFDKLTSTSFASNPDKVGGQNNYYDFEFGDLEISLEKALGNLESCAAAHVARIIRDGHLHLEDERERADLAAFFAVQLLRTPAQEASSQEAFARMETWLRAQGMADSFFAFDTNLGSKENARRAERIKMVHRAPEVLGPHFVEKDWVLLSTDRSSRFLLGDHPLTMHNSRDYTPRGNLGVRVAGIELYCPLTPKFALAMHCPTSAVELEEAVLQRAHMSWEQALADSELGTRPWGPAVAFLQAVRMGTPLSSEPTNVTFLNSLQIASAERFLFASHNDFSLALEMIAQDAKLRHGMRLSETTGKF
jgi:hypothetical protein